MSDKTYDPEETRSETAQRLVKDAINKRAERTHRLINRLAIHARQLSRSDRMAAVEYLRRDADLVIGLLEQTGEDDLREFSFPSEAIDEEWNVR